MPSPPSDPWAIRRWLIDIQHHIVMAEGFVEGMGYTTCKDDDLHLYAVCRCLEIISEASRRLPTEWKRRHPSIDWRAVAGAGNIYRHDYEDVAAHRVWRTLTIGLPLSRVGIEEELTALGG